MVRNLRRPSVSRSAAPRVRQLVDQLLGLIADSRRVLPGLREAQRAGRRERLPGLQQRLQAGEDHRPAAEELSVGVLAQLIVGD